MQQALLTLIVSPELEETLVDWLLEQEHVHGFTSMQVYGHGSGISTMTVGEQVMGRQKRTQFMVHGETPGLERLLQGLRQAYPKAGLHYFLSPLISAGPIAGESPR